MNDVYIVNTVWILKIYVMYEFSIYFTCEKARPKMSKFFGRRDVKSEFFFK